jgi:hypothetical protein
MVAIIFYKSFALKIPGNETTIEAGLSIGAAFQVIANHRYQISWARQGFQI